MILFNFFLTILLVFGLMAGQLIIQNIA